MKTVPLADVLWRAANEHLGSGQEFEGQLFSCNAALEAEHGIEYRRCRDIDELRSKSVTNKFLAELGCKTNSMCAFDDPFAYETQGVRYMWLLLAMHVAEDENLTVEIAK